MKESDKKKFLLSIGNRIRTVRKEKGYSQEKLSELCGYNSRSTINKIEMGINDIPQSKLQVIANVLNVSPAFLIGEEDRNGNPIEEQHFMSEKSDEEQHYYTNEETKALAEELRTNKELKVLFDAAKDASPEDLQTTYDMLLALKRKEQREDE